MRHTNLFTMKRFVIIFAVAVWAIGSASAQKRVVEALTAEVEALKQQLVESKASEEKLQQDRKSVV